MTDVQDKSIPTLLRRERLRNFTVGAVYTYSNGARTQDISLTRQLNMKATGGLMDDLPPQYLSDEQHTFRVKHNPKRGTKSLDLITEHKVAPALNDGEWNRLIRAMQEI